MKPKRETNIVYYTVPVDLSKIPEDSPEVQEGDTVIVIDGEMEIKGEWRNGRFQKEKDK